MASAPCKHLFIPFLLLLVILGCLIPRATSSRLLAEDDILLAQQHKQWMGKHNRIYRDEEERVARLKIFKSNVEYIESFNRAGGHKYKLGITEFADLTNEEFNSMINSTGVKPVIYPKGMAATTSFKYENLTDVPQSVDWRLSNSVTPVKNQGVCGCCWAFAAVAAMEAAVKMKTGELISLSEQQLVDCDVDGSNYGCRGGFASAAFDYVLKNGGLTTEANYPYRGDDSNVCDSAKAAVAAATITNYESVQPRYDAGALLKAVANQPVYAVIYAGSRQFQFFQGDGVFDDYCGESNHAVAVIGYGTEADGTRYWLVKNSWGTSWGDGGFGKIGMDSDDGAGVCSILRETMYPVA